jgi:hypothetical protein
LLRNEEKKRRLKNTVNQFIIADVTQPDQLKGVCKDIGIVVSSLEKSVSIYDKSKPTFRKIDFEANTNILNEALKEKK